MKLSHYDVLQVSPRAIPEVIQAAYQNLKPGLVEKAREGSQEARNQLLFLEEAYLVLLSPEKRAAYDESLAQTSPAARPAQDVTYAYVQESTFLGWWGDSKTTRFLIAIAFFSALFAAYKFTGQRGEQKILTNQVKGGVHNDSYRAESERVLVQGSVQNQGELINKSYDIAAQEAERRRTELEYRANANSQMLDMQRQRLEAQQQQQKWAQEQYEKERQVREARAAADAPKKQLCNMYALSGNVRDARAAGCY